MIDNKFHNGEWGNTIMRSSHEGGRYAAALTSTAPALHTQPLLLWLCCSRNDNLCIILCNSVLEALSPGMLKHGTPYSICSTWQLILLYFSGSYLLKAIVTQCIGKIFIATPKQDKSGTLVTGVRCSQHNSCWDRWAQPWCNIIVGMLGLHKGLSKASEQETLLLKWPVVISHLTSLCQ